MGHFVMFFLYLRLIENAPDKALRQLSVYVAEIVSSPVMCVTVWFVGFVCLLAGRETRPLRITVRSVSDRFV